MREIKFRVYFEADEDEPSWMSEPITLLDLLHGEDIEFRNEEDTVSLPLNDFRFFYNKNAKYKILEYTGLHDKNGKEIYEGDIVKNFFVNTDKNGNEIYKYHILEIKYDELMCCYNIDCFANCEVIGNIYSNPELLEKGKE